MEKNKIKKSTAKRLLAVIEKHEREILLSMFYDITDPRLENSRLYWVSEACYFHESLLKFIFAVEHNDYSEIGEFELEKILHKHQDQLALPDYKNNTDLLWFEKKIKNIIANWKDVKPKKKVA